MEVVSLSWSFPAVGVGMAKLGVKLKPLKHKLKDWNKIVFGDIFTNLKVAEEEVVHAERNFDAMPTDENLINMNRCTALLQHALSIEKDFWRQKAACKWILHGERNTRYFHSVVTEKCARTTINSVTHDGYTLSDVHLINKESGVEFFRSLLTADKAQSSMPLLQNVPRLVSSEQGEALYQSTNADEIIYEDVLEAVQHFLSGSTLPLNFTATSISLIPKVKNPTQWSDYRPISLCNTTNKILTKLLNDRIKKILPDLIVPNQSGFVPSRQIHDNILLAQEVIHSISAHKSDWNVAFKLDMAKAYDRVDWEFLKMVLLQLGFPPQLILLVNNCITNCWFSVLINGSLSGFFKSTRGLRQGDPLTPTLFVLAAEYFSRNLNRLMEIDKSLAFKGSQGISHLAYADDILIFTNSREKSLETVMEFLQEFEHTSGQLISPEKSSFIISPKAPMAVKRRIKSLTGFMLKTFPFIYLGAPIYVGRQKIEYFDRLIDGMSTKIGGWEKKFLSYGGSLQIIKLKKFPGHIQERDRKLPLA
ncbi:UNVERIFIED_CONTAM: hypothetical protein Sradi_2052600 [Sesamum radiatum]|uniref:Reverse transcriptase domain-containing protein n=1 Tax=Sesamum radiatum TaxID=300843 RepID=A0AAW2TIX6_SESRA